MNERVENCTLNRNWIWNGKEYLDINTWNEAIEQAAITLKLSYPDHAFINAYCSAIRSIKK